MGIKVIVGRAIGEFLTRKEIPPAFKTVIEAAVSYSREKYFKGKRIHQNLIEFMLKKEFDILES